MNHLELRFQFECLEKKKMLEEKNENKGKLDFSFVLKNLNAKDNLGIYCSLTINHYNKQPWLSAFPSVLSFLFAAVRKCLLSGSL